MTPAAPSANEQAGAARECGACSLCCRLLRVDEAALGPRTRILLVATEAETLGLLVDEVFEVHRLYDDDIERANVVLGSDVSEAVSGIARAAGAADRVIVLLDLRVLLR